VSTAVVVAMLMAGMMYFRKMESCQKKGNAILRAIPRFLLVECTSEFSCAGRRHRTDYAARIPGRAGDFLCHFHVHDVHEVHRCFDAILLSPFVSIELGFDPCWILAQPTSIAETIFVELAFLIERVIVRQVVDSLSCP